MNTVFRAGMAPGFGKTVAFSRMILAGVLGRGDRSPAFMTGGPSASKLPPFDVQSPAFARNNLSAAVRKAQGCLQRTA
ncbi:hypothetical protein L4Z68_001410 [Pseudomonas aeruginosa]|nr:hypothetical protein [Pseudomonas aeruginosa]EKX2969417.1 hypothetical protein [Pseudomonas aeruginosa]HBO8004214.1 hypothetical protein [Pseudomonas aeruginosa]HDV6123096.1 hypothetical protein [Pseudomonas aeruginosa]HDV6143974.1 hypothetical protein [Pseudomonas aeruginosa]